MIFDGMIDDMISHKKLSPIVTELLLDDKNEIFPPFLSHNRISKRFQTKLRKSFYYEN